MEELILSALSGNNIIEFTYDGYVRICEAHVLGMANGVKQVLCKNRPASNASPLESRALGVANEVT